jgi:diguanylate cyclase (GGDEF) domain
MNKQISFDDLCTIIDLTSSTMDNYMFVCDLVNHFHFYISKTATERFVFDNHDVEDFSKAISQFVYPDDLPALVQDMKESVLDPSKNSHNMIYRWLDKNNRPIWINCRGILVKDEKTRPLYLVGCINEIGVKPKADNVSGLLRDTSLLTYLNGVDNVHLEGYILRIGVDDLRGINARLGMEYGDRVLRIIAKCINNCLKNGECFYRIDGDEFIILNLHDPKIDNAILLFNSIQNEVESYMERNHYEVVFSVSCGILSSEDIEDYSYSNIMKLSEFALTQAKTHGKNTCSIFNRKKYQNSLKERALLIELRKAVDDNFRNFDIYYQPLYNQDHSIYGAEALLRFYSLEFGYVPPSIIIPILEETGLILPIGNWVIEKALTTCKNMQQYIPGFKVSINISYVQVLKIDIVKEFLSVMKELDLSPTNVIVELTESRYLESNYRHLQTWQRLKEAGISLALDDFGTGYANFHYLDELKPNIIKIDRSFVNRAMDNDFEYALLKNLSKLSKELDLNLCIEGIETKEECSKILQLKPTYCQGYYFGKPYPYDVFKQLYLGDLCMIK